MKSIISDFGHTDECLRRAGRHFPTPRDDKSVSSLFRSDKERSSERSPLAEKGDTAAQYDLADGYHEGRLCVRNPRFVTTAALCKSGCSFV